MSLSDHIAELEKHVAKLRESNVELAAFFAETSDALYYDGIEENKLVIVRKETQIVELRRTLEESAAQRYQDDDDADIDAE